MIIKKDDVINASNLFPIVWDDFYDYMIKNNFRFGSFNGKVFDFHSGEINYNLDYKKAICNIEDTIDGFEYEYIPKVFFTSDTHFGAERTLKLSRRPFNSVEEMDKIMIENWNSIVGKGDIVYHLGDFGNYDIIKQLNGEIILIFGNYEKKDIEEQFNYDMEAFIDKLLDIGFYDVYELDDIACYRKTIKNNMIYMAHEPSKLPKTFTDNKKWNEVHLFGHIHERQMIKRFGLNVGVDCHNFKPIDLDTVLFYDNALKNFYDEEVFM